MRVGRTDLRRAWDSALTDTVLAPRNCVVILLKSRAPRWAAAAGYLHPAGFDRPQGLLKPAIMRHVPSAVLDRYRDRHQLAMWALVPRLPVAFLELLLRHELQHADQWRRYGRPFIELDGALRQVWDVDRNSARYLELPSEREANLASAAYAERMRPRAKQRLRRHRRYRHLTDEAVPALENDVLTLTVQALRQAMEAGLKADPELSEDDLVELEQAARRWPPDALRGLDDDHADLVVVGAAG
jgi:hypothetical protein